MPVDMHVEDAGTLEEEMVVQRRYLKPVSEQRRHDRIHFVFQENEITHHYVVAASRPSSWPASRQSRKESASRCRRS